MTCGVDNRLVHEEPEAHAPRSCRAVHLPRDKERAIPGTPDVLSGNLRKVEYERVKESKDERSKDLGIKDLHEEASLRASCVVSQRITTAVSRRCPLPVQLVNCVPRIGVAPTGNVDLCMIFKSKD